MFAILHLTPANQLNLFQQIWRILAKDGLFMLTPLKKAPGYFKNTHEGDQVRLGVIDGFIKENRKCYEAHFPVEWYIITLKTLGFELMV